MNEDLPIIKIVSEEEEMHIKLELEMEDVTKEILVCWGKEDASDEDYVNIAIREGLRNAIEEAEKEEKEEKEEADFVELDPFLQEKYNLTAEGKPSDE